MRLTTPTIDFTVSFTNMSVSYLNPLPFIYYERNGQSQTMNSVSCLFSNLITIHITCLGFVFTVVSAYPKMCSKTVVLYGHRT